MNVNGVTSQIQAVSGSNTAKEATRSHAKESPKTISASTESGVVYEPSATVKARQAQKSYKPDAAMIQKLKADAEARTQQLQSLVEKMMSGQATAYGKANDIWTFLREGNFTVDPATKAQAQADIAEDGYWGVKQTSSRILDFATALTGGDPDKIEEMRAAFKKGYEKAEKIWGGKLPDISQKTYDAVMKGFDDMAEASK